MYKYTVTEYQQLPPSLGGNWDCGKSITTCFSRSPKKACAMKGVVVWNHVGVEGCPIMDRRTLERDGKIIFDIWD